MRLLLQRLRRLLAVEPSEGRLVLWSAATLFLIESASVGVSNVSDTLFLKRVGIDYLPIVFLANSLLLTATTIVAGRLLVRFNSRRFLAIVFGTLSLFLALLWLLVLQEAPGIATTLVIVSKQIDVVALLLFWAVVQSLMTSRQGKRLVALMTAGGTLGTILGSFLSGPIGRLFGIPSLLAFAAIIFAIAAVATIPLSRSATLRLIRPGSRPLIAEPPPPLRGFWRESSLFRMLVATSFLAGVLGPMLYFEFSRAADLATQTADGEQRLLALYGQLRGWINVGVLAVQVGGSAALFRIIGVPAAATLAPAAYLAGFTGLAARFGLATAMPAQMATSVLDHTIYEPALRILGNLLPQRVRVAANNVVQGPAKRFGAAVGSLVVLVVVAVVPVDIVALVAIPIAGMWMALALLLWRNYPNLLLEAARVRQADAEEEDILGTMLNTGTLRMLRRNLEGSDEGLCRAACELLVDSPPAESLGSLARAVARAKPEHRGFLLEAIDRVLAKPGAAVVEDWSLAANLLGTLAGSTDLEPVSRAKLIQVLGRAFAGRRATAEMRACLERACEDSSPIVATVGRIAAFRVAGVAVPAASLDEIVERGLASENLEVRSLVVAELRFELLRSAGDPELRARRLDMLTSHLRDTAGDGGNAEIEDLLAALRTEALTVLADVALDDPATAQQSLSIVRALADDENVPVRAAALRFLGNAGLEEYADLIAARLSSRHAEEAEAARDALEHLGPRAADALLHALRHGGRRAREVVPGLLRDMQADPAVLRGVIDREIAASRERLILIAVLEAAGQSRLVLQRLRERVDESMHTVLELLSAIIDDERIARVCRSLGRSWNVRDRAVLLEALEALLPAEESARILPLLEDHGTQRLAVAASDGSAWPTIEEAIARLLQSSDFLTVALVAATTEEQLLRKVAPKLDVAAAQRLFSQGRRGSGAADRDAADATAFPHLETEMLSPVEKMLHLRTLDLFEGLTTRQLSELARVVREVTLPAGEVVVHEGKFEDSMYFIVRGTVRITKGTQPLAELKERDFFGEMSVFDGETRSATATAEGEVVLLSLSRHDLFEVLEDQPAIGIGICQTLVRRIRGLLEERAEAWRKQEGQPPPQR
jgi:CRP/FNR family cyclic AMP-dependent transcriptional regulator